MLISSVVEDKILAGLYRLTDFAMCAGPHLRPKYFASAMGQNLAKIALEYNEKFSGTPSPLYTIDTLKKLVADKVISPAEMKLYGDELKRLQAVDLKDIKYVTEQLIAFVKEREWRALIEDAVKKHLPKSNFAAIEKEASRIANISAAGEARVVDYFSDKAIDNRAERRESEMRSLGVPGAVGISTGIKKMDDVFPKGGFYRKELYVFMAPPKRGKTMSLLWFANSAAKQGKNVMFFSCETSEEVLSDRLDAMNSSMKIRDLPASFKAVQAELKAKRASGKLYILDYPTKTLTLEEIERQVKKREREDGVHIDMVVVDYGDIMKPPRLYNDNALKEQAEVFEGLRRLAGVLSLPVVTATQVNRTGSKKSVIDGSDTAGTFEKIMVADYIITFSASDSERSKGELKIRFSDCRNAEERTLRIKTSFGMGRFYEEYIEEVH